MMKLILLTLTLISPELFAQSNDGPNALTHIELTRVCGGLLLVLMVIMALSWIAKRLQVVNLSTSKGFQTIASMALGPKERIILLRVGTRYFLTGAGGGAVTLLYDFGEQLPAGFDTESRSSFAEVLKSAVRKS